MLIDNLLHALRSRFGNQADATTAPILDTQQIRQLQLAAARWKQSVTWPDRPMHSGRPGDWLSHIKGSGMEFADNRVYASGDDPRHVDWRASARSTQMQVRVYHEERQPGVCLVVDRRASMRFGTRGSLKVTRAARAALFIAAVEARERCDISALLLQPDHQHGQWLPPTSGQQALPRLARELAKPCPPLVTQAADLPWSSQFDRLGQQLPMGTRIAIVSDFHGLQKQAALPLARLAHTHPLWMISIHDVAERKLPNAGLLQLSWGDTERLVDSDRQADIFHEDGFLKGLCQRSGALHSELHGQPGGAEDDLATDLVAGRRRYEN